MAIDVISVKAEYDGSAEGAKAAAKEAADAVDRMADQVTAASRKVDAASGRMDAFSLGMAKLAAQSKATYGPMDKLGDEIKQTGDQADNADGKMKGLGDQVDKTGEKAKKARISMQELGSTLSTHVTLPLVAAGGAAVKFASDVETNFAHIEGLVGITGQSLEDLKAKTVALAGSETGKGVRELSDAMYFITSSGLQGSKAVDALESSARAASAGLGSTAQVADAVTSAVNAYTQSNLSAAEATDIMVNVVKEGKVEADQLAGSIGAVIPIASTAGVSFDQVGAAVALLSRNGASAGEAVTQVRSAIDAIIKPSVQARNMLAGVGLTTDDLKKSLSEQGLLGTMRLLRDRFGSDTESLGKWAGRIEALNAILAITNGDAAETDRVFQSLKDSTGATDQAFDAISKTAGFKMRQALADVEGAGISLGDKLLPIAGDIAGAVAGAAREFGEMDQTTQNAVLAVAGIAAAAGPAIKAVDGLTKSWQAFNTMSAAGGVGIGVAGVLAAGTVLYLDHRDAVQKSAEAQKIYTQALKDVDDPAQTAVDRLHDLVDKINDSKTAAGEATPELEGLANGVRKIFENEGAVDVADKLGVSMQRVAEITRDGTDVFQALAAATGPNGIQWALRGATDAQRAFAEEIIQAEKNGAISKGEMKDLFLAIDQVADASDDAKESQAAFAKVAAYSAVGAGIVTQAWVDQTVAANGGKYSLDAWIRTGEQLANVNMSNEIEDIAGKALEAGVGFDNLNTAAGGTPSTFEKVRAEFERTEQKADDVRQAIEDMQTALTGAFDAEGAQREAAVKLAESHQKLHDKTKALDDAIRTYGEGSEQAAVADYERTRALDETEAAARAKAEADVNAATKQAESMGVTMSAKDQNYIYRDSLVATRDATGDPQLRQYLDDLIYRLDLERLRAEAAADALNHRNREIYAAAGMDVNYTSRDSSGQAVVRRAGGGPLFAKQLAVVGEEGPELFVPNSAGTVLDAPTTAMMIQAASTYPVIRNAQDLLRVQASGRTINEDMFTGDALAVGGFGDGYVRFADGTVAPLDVAQKVADAMIKQAQAETAANAAANETIEKFIRDRALKGLETTPAMLAAKAAPPPPIVATPDYGTGLGLPGGGFSKGPATDGKRTVPVPVNVPEILPDVTGLVGPATAAGPLGRFGSFAYPSTLPRATPATTVIVNVQVDGWSNADPRQLGRAAYQALSEEARRRGNTQLKDVLAGIGRL